MEIDTSNLTDEQISKLSEYVHKMEEENKETKWWVIATYSPFADPLEYNQFGPCYTVAPQQDIYSRSNPPLKSNFNTREEAQEWLDKYLVEEDKFLKAKDDINTLFDNFSTIIDKLSLHQYITNTDIHKCIEPFNESWDKGSISKVVKEENE